MIDVPDKSNNTNKKKRYNGLKPKLIHLKGEVFQILDTTAKMKGSNLKEYIEYLCTAQAMYEAKNFIKKQTEKK